MTFPILSLVIWLPAIFGILILFSGTQIISRLLAILGSAITLGLVTMLALDDGLELSLLNHMEEIELSTRLGFGYRIGLDGWGVVLLLLTALLCFTGVLLSLKLEERVNEFYALLLLLTTGVMGVFVAQDLLLFFFFYELAILPMYLLISIWGSSQLVKKSGPLSFSFDRLLVGHHQYAAMKLTIMLFLGSILILIGIFSIWSQAQSFELYQLAQKPVTPELQYYLFPILWVGFGILAGLFPFHTWSPDGHASAPTAVSMLHAGVLMKLGAFGVLRIAMVLLPEGASIWAPWVMTFACINVIYGAMCALGQRDLKYVIAYSSVSHMGIVFIGIASLDQSGLNGAIYQCVAHGLMTALFFGVIGVLYHSLHHRDIVQMSGFMAKAPRLAVFFGIALCSSIALPGFGGFIAELLVLISSFKRYEWLSLIALLGAWISALYLLRAFRKIFMGKLDEQAPQPIDSEGFEFLALALLAIALLVIGIYPSSILDFIDKTSGYYFNLLISKAG